MNITNLFSDFSRYIARIAGQPACFILAAASIIIWLILGPLFSFSDTWQLVINTASSIVTFLMVFLIQNTQNRDGEAIQIKLDELIRAHRGAHNALLDLEELTEEQLGHIKDKYETLARASRNELFEGKKDTQAVEI